jgi:RNA 3'-terminal phosphate cyclase (ATP)
MQAFGLRAELHLKSCGFYPQGGGEFRAVVPAHAEPPTLVDIPARGTLRDVELTSFVAGLPLSVAERQASAAQSALREKGILADAENLPLPGPGKGTAVFIRAHFENSVAAFTALGERGKPAEDVGREAAQQIAEFMASSGAVEEHLADQLLLPAALLAAGKLGPSSPGTTYFTTAKVTDHLTTNARVLERFLPTIRIDVGQDGDVRVSPRA